MTDGNAALLPEGRMDARGRRYRLGGGARRAPANPK